MPKLSDLNDRLFAQLDRLASSTLTPEQLEAEVARSEAMVALSDSITENSKVMIAAAKLFAEHRDVVLPHLPLIGKAD